MLFIGIWKRAGHGLVRQQGAQLVWEFEALSLGYWAASLSPGSPGKTLSNVIHETRPFALSTCCIYSIEVCTLEGPNGHHVVCNAVGFLEQIMAQLTDYHSILLLAILAGLVLLLLAFSCLLLCYCR